MVGDKILGAREPRPLLRPLEVVHPLLLRRRQVADLLDPLRELRGLRGVEGLADGDEPVGVEGGLDVRR